MVDGEVKGNLNLSFMPPFPHFPPPPSCCGAQGTAATMCRAVAETAPALNKALALGLEQPWQCPCPVSSVPSAQGLLLAVH